MSAVSEAPGTWLGFQLAAVPQLPPAALVQVIVAARAERSAPQEQCVGCELQVRCTRTVVSHKLLRCGRCWAQSGIELSHRQTAMIFLLISCFPGIQIPHSRASCAWESHLL